MTEGDTLDEALANARDAITVYLLSLRDEGLDIPEPDAGTIQVRAIAVDLDAA